MKVCLMNDSFPPVIDGVANAVVNYAEVIQGKLGSCVVATPEYPGAQDDYSFPVLRYPSLNTEKLVGYRTGLPFEVSTLYKLASGKPDLIHTHCPATSALLARSLRDVTGAPVVLTYHTKFDVDIQKAVRGKFLQEAAIKALVANVDACDEVWVVSRGAGKNLESLGYRGSWRVMENGVDLPRGRAEEAAVRETTEAYNLPPDLPVFLFVGRLMWYKGVRLILDGLSRFRERGHDFRMVFVGSGGDEQEIRDYVEGCALGEKTVFTGAIRSREALRAWYSRADLLLFPSTFDTNGLVVREAAACALPALLVSGSCAAEGILDGENGLLIREDPESLSDKLQSVSPARLREIGERAQAELYLSWEESVHRAWNRYGEILELWSGSRKKKRLLTPVEDVTEAILELREALDQAREKAMENRNRSPLRRFTEKRSDRSL